MKRFTIDVEFFVFGLVLLLLLGGSGGQFSDVVIDLIIALGISLAIALGFILLLHSSRASMPIWRTTYPRESGLYLLFVGSASLVLEAGSLLIGIPVGLFRWLSLVVVVLAVSLGLGLALLTPH